MLIVLIECSPYAQGILMYWYINQTINLSLLNDCTAFGYSFLSSRWINIYGTVAHVFEESVICSCESIIFIVFWHLQRMTE